MEKLSYLVTGVLLVGLTAAQADPIRPLFTLENRLLGTGGIEAGVAAGYSEFDTSTGVFPDQLESYEFSAAMRFGVTPNVNLFGVVPFGTVDSDLAGSETDFGDLALGMQVKVFEDIFNYPYIIPHVTVGLPTGDEGIGVGTGETSVRFGTTVGTRTLITEELVWNFDFAYQVFEDSDNVFTGGVSLIWELSEQFALVAEGQYANESPDPDQNNSFLYAGGMIWEPHPDWTYAFHVGGGEDAQQETLAVLRVTFSF